MNSPVTESSEAFSHTLPDLKTIAADVLRYGRQLNASAVAVEISDGFGRSVSVRRGKLDAVELHQKKSIAVTVYDGKRKGRATTGDFSKEAIVQALGAAFDIARFTGDDEFSGLPDESALEHAPLDLELFHPWALSVSDAIAVAKETENAAFEASPLVNNSNGAWVATSGNQRVLGMSNGFLEGFATSSHLVGCSAIAGNGDDMHSGFWSSLAVEPSALDVPRSIGRIAAERAARHVGARRLGTRKVPVLFDSVQAAELLRTFSTAVSGSAVYQKSSFLCEALGRPIFPEHVRIEEDAHLRRRVGSAPYDSEGVRTGRRAIVERGILEGYFLSTYSARRLGRLSTGNAGGPHNLSITSEWTQPGDSFATMLRKLGTGLLVTDTMGNGVNLVSGGYSRGAGGFWVENGVIQYPVNEITIAGTLQEMFMNIVAVGSDVHVSGALSSGSLLIDGMTVAGSDAN